jgi:hypothetical protein
MSPRVLGVSLVMLMLVSLYMPSARAQAQAAASTVSGVVTDETGGVLPGVEVRLRVQGMNERVAFTDPSGRYVFSAVPAGEAQLSFTMLNFATARREVRIDPGASVDANAVLHYVMNADVTVTGDQPFVNLADAENPAENLVGIAQSASQGAITARQLQFRPLSRAGEVLETVPGIIVSQHSGEGKANQYYLRGFNLDHGTDFATTVASIPVNMPTHAHGHGYTDLNFLIPELVNRVQYSKGPYFADQGDFATAGAATITYANSLERPILRATAGPDAFTRVLAAGSLARAQSQMLAALEVEHDDGPWVAPEGLRKINAVARYSRGSSLTGVSVTGMAYDSRWNATDQIPRRAVASGRLDRFDTVDATDGGSSSRYSVSLELSRAHAQTLTTASAYALRYRLSLFSNFTYFLDDPVHGDQFQQSDARTVFGGRVVHRRMGRWLDRPVQFTAGAQTRTDAIDLALNHTAMRELLDTVRADHVLQTSLAGYVEASVDWTPWLRSLSGVRADGYRFRVDAISEPLNSGRDRAGIVSPKGGIVIGPFGGTEFYANAGTGFHSNDARGATITVDPATGEPAERVTPLARARGSEIGVRTVAIPHLQSTLSVWALGLASELVFIGDAGTTDAGRPSHRDGIEFANYYHPVDWLTLDADLSWSRARFTDGGPDTAIPGAVRTVVSGGATVDGVRRMFGSMRLRYFGPRPLVEDDSRRSKATTLVNAQTGYRWSDRVRIFVDGLNLLNAADSDIDYFYTSRLPGEPFAGVDDLHFHPALPRTFRVSLNVEL